MTKKISVVIPTYNDSVDECLKFLNEQTMPKSEYEVIVVDNNSNKVDIRRTTSKYNFVTYLRETRKGSYYARNRGWKHAQGDIVAFTDADCRPEKHWLENVLKFFENPNNVAMGGAIIKSPPMNWVERNTRNLADGQTRLRYKSYYRYPYVVAANMAFRKKILEELGGFDTSYSSGSDGDFCWRLAQRGYELKLEPEAVVLHPSRSSVKAYFKQNYNYGIGHPLQFKRYYPKRIKVYFDKKNFQDLFRNVFYLPVGFTLFVFHIDKDEKFAKSVLEIVRASGIIWGRIKGSIKYRVLYI